MLKKIIACLIVLNSFFISVASAELIPVKLKFFKDCASGKASCKYRNDNDISYYEDEQIKVHLRDVLGSCYQIGITSKKAFTSSHTDGLYRTIQFLLGGRAQYTTAIGVVLDITNKTNEVMFIDLNKSLISIGSYQGKPIVGGIKYIDSQSASIPPIIIMPGKTVTKELYRGDSEFLDNGEGGRSWVAPCDFPIGRNIFGDGTFLFAIGDGNAKFVPMMFYRELDLSSIEQYREK